LQEHEEFTLLHKHLVESARRYGNAVAIIDEEKPTTFDQLVAQAFSLAATLNERGLSKGDRVALLMPKSTEAIISLFATLLAGGIYVPLEPKWPSERIESNLTDCSPRFVVTKDPKNLTNRIPSLSVMSGTADSSPLIFDVREGKGLSWHEALAGRGSRWRESPVLPEDPALILFTSGSTGRPKGVTLSHKAVAAFVRWSAHEFAIDERDRLGCPSSLNFDLSTFDIFNMALCGAACVIIPEQIVWMPRFLAQFMAIQRITAWYCVPSLLSSLLAEKNFANGHFPDLRLAIFAGEVLPGRDVERLRTIVPDAALYNLYGPTETNVVTWYRVPDGFAPDHPVPIGNACPYAELKFDPAGVERGDGEETGDLLVAGDSLMLGYWNSPLETAKAFVDCSGNGESLKRFYRTGDRVSLDLTTGHYVFVGRKDRQVKRRGYRIELGEIENALRRHPGILEAAVISTQDEHSKTSIIAFVRGDSHAPISSVEIRTHCTRYLPAYMMPDRITFLTVIPRSSRGKTDYAALAEMLKRRSEMDIKDALRQYFKTYRKGAESPDLLDDTPLVSSGIIDSIGIVGLIDFIENKFGIEFMPRELDRDSLETIERIEKAIRIKLGDEGVR
jgi:amino acid adenylation domain-containing protein